MAFAGKTSSPRDHEADNNVDLARKRPRLSEDPDASPPSPVLVEACDPEDLGSNMAFAIQIDDEPDDQHDLDYLAAWATDLFDCTPNQRLLEIESQIHRHAYLGPHDFLWISAGLRRHIQNTGHLDPLSMRKYFEHKQTSDFFASLAFVANYFLINNNCFEPSVDLRTEDMQLVFQDLLAGLQHLCQRIILLLPHAIKAALTRRDSAHGSIPRPSIPLLRYIILADRVASDSVGIVHFVKHDSGQSLRKLHDHGLAIFGREDVLSAMVDTIGGISGLMRDLPDSWLALESVMNIFLAVISTRRLSSDDLAFPTMEAEAMLDLLHRTIAPAVTGKHPRALPDNFHSKLAHLGEIILSSCARISDLALDRLYKLYVQTPADALIPESKESESVSTALLRTCDNDLDHAASLLATSWAFQRMKDFICSEIMDVRGVGVSLLRTRLVNVFNNKPNLDPFRQLVIDFAVRFLRVNEMTSYIFGPESHAGLISQSVNVIVFLGATGAHTEAETDIIWRACTTSVETDFVKAAVTVLACILQWLDLRQLMYLASKYTSTPLSKLDTHTVELLSEVIKALEIKTPTDRMDFVLVILRLLKHADTSEPSQSAARVRMIALQHVNSYAGHKASSGNRGLIFDYCIPAITQTGQQSTSAIHILEVLIRGGTDADEMTRLREELPISAIVDEICNYVMADPDTHGVLVRLDCLLGMMSLYGHQCDPTTEARLFQHLFARSELQKELRDAAWKKLHEMAAGSGTSMVFYHLWHALIENHVPSLPAEMFTSQLIQLVGPRLSSQFASADACLDYPALLQLPLWKALVRVATTSYDADVLRDARQSVLHLLFGHPYNMRAALEPIAVCQTEFVRDLIQGLQAAFAAATESQTPDRLHAFTRSMDLLWHLLACSRKCVVDLKSWTAPESLVLDNANAADDRITFVVELYGPEMQPRKLSVVARSSTKLHTLMARLPTLTGAGRNKIYAAGVEITEAKPDRRLDQAGIHPLGSLLICPRFTVDDDIDRGLSPVGPIEQEIIARYASIEAFLDGPPSLAHKAFEFLQNLRPSRETRERVLSSTADIYDLFPKDRSYRTRFSLSVLARHEFDCKRVAVVDRSFSAQAVQRLSNFVMDETRPTDAPLMIQVLNTLVVFLRETPNEGHIQPYFPNPERFASRMFALVTEAQQISGGETYHDNSEKFVRVELAAAVYFTLLLACQTDAALWGTVTSQGDTLLKVHEDLFFDTHQDLSERITRQIGQFCAFGDAFPGAIGFYWDIIVAALPEALAQNDRSYHFFGLAVDLLNGHRALCDDENAMRKLVEELLGHLASYKHSESPATSAKDEGISGLLHLLEAATAILKSHKTPLEQHHLPPLLFDAFLFPPLDSPSHQPLVDVENRHSVYALIKSTSTKDTDYGALIKSARSSFRRNDRDPTWKFPGLQSWWRKMDYSAGLANLNNTCYMNSLLQQMYANLQFRQFIFSQPVEDEDKQRVLHQLQQLFSSMQDSLELYIWPMQLAQALDIQIGPQEDVHQFYTTLLSRLEDEMPDQATKTELTRFFTGRSITQIKGECNHVSSRVEPFTELSITVKNKANLIESLREFVQGEPLAGANKYMCMTCADGDNGTLVEAHKRTCLEDVPNSLTFCLKRFSYDNYQDGGENKVNDRFEFPAEVDMSPFKRESLEDPKTTPVPDIFELVGVIVHSGSLAYGHYWSYVRVAGLSWWDPAAWMYVEDERSKLVDGGIREVQEQCYGGLTGSDGTERPDSGYVLFYQRQSYVNEAKEFNTVPSSMQYPRCMLPKVQLPDRIADIVREDNIGRAHTAAVFDEQFHSFIIWLLQRFTHTMTGQPAGSDDAGQGHDYDTNQNANDLEPAVADLFARFMILVALPDPSAEARLTNLRNALTDMLATQSKLAVHILSSICQDDYAFHAIIRRANVKARNVAFEIIQICLAASKANDAEDTYQKLVVRVVNVHEQMRNDCRIDSVPGRWNEYLAFATTLAKQGMFETQVVLNSGLIAWIYDMIFMLLDGDGARKRHPMIGQWLSKAHYDRSSLFLALYELFSGHMDLTEPAGGYPKTEEDRICTDRGWVLVSCEIDPLLRMASNRRWMLFQAACHYCVCETATAVWQDWAPGKLIGLMLSDEANPDFGQHIEELLIYFINVEEEKLPPLLWATLQFCANVPDEQCKRVLTIMAKNLVLWESERKRGLHFFRQVHEFAPIALVETLPFWARKFLIEQQHKPLVQRLTAAFLHDIVFAPEPLSDNPVLDATRIRHTRAFVKECIGVLDEQLLREYHPPLEPFAPAIDAMRHAQDYISRFRAAVIASQRDALPSTESTPSSSGEASTVTIASSGKTSVSGAILLEFDETEAVLGQLDRVLGEVRDWEKDVTALPTRGGRSVGFEGAEALGEEESDEEGSSEDEMLSG